jgi:hypothetical protein
MPKIGTCSCTLDHFSNVANIDDVGQLSESWNLYSVGKN